MSQQKRNGHVVQFDARIRGWKRIECGVFYPNMDTTQPEAYLLDVQGQRTDDVVFTVKIALDKRKIDMIPTPAISLRVVTDALQNALKRLQTFKDCECTVKTSCKEHQTQ